MIQNLRMDHSHHHNMLRYVYTSYSVIYMSIGEHPSIRTPLLGQCMLRGHFNVISLPHSLTHTHTHTHNRHGLVRLRVLVDESQAQHSDSISNTSLFPWHPSKPHPPFSPSPYTTIHCSQQTICNVSCNN